jgi:hypothetical protein
MAATSDATAKGTSQQRESDSAQQRGGTHHHRHESDRFLLDSAADRCITSADCAFNGECVKTHTQSHTTNATIAAATKPDPEAPGSCDCFPGWTGNTCEVLDLLPVDPQEVGLVLPNKDSSTWGGSVLHWEGDGLYHMFASEILYDCGLYSWTTNSQVRVRLFRNCHS